MHGPGAVLVGQIVAVLGPHSCEDYHAFGHRPFVHVDMEPVYISGFGVHIDKLIETIAVEVVDGCLHRGRRVPGHFAS